MRTRPCCPLSFLVSIGSPTGWFDGNYSFGWPLYFYSGWYDSGTSRCTFSSLFWCRYSQFYLKIIDASTGQLLWLTLLSNTSTTHLMGLFQMSIGEEFQPDWSGALYTPGFVVSLLLYPILSLLYYLPSFSSFYSQYSFGHSGLLDISSETIWLPSYRANSVIVFCISIYASLLLSVYCSIHFSLNLAVKWVVLPCHEENWIVPTYEYYKWWRLWLIPMDL